MDKATAVTCRPQMGIFLSAGHFDVPHRLPGLIELAVNWVNPRVVRSHCIAHICWDAMLLEVDDIEKGTGYVQMSRNQSTEGKDKEKVWSGEKRAKRKGSIYCHKCRYTTSINEQKFLKLLLLAVLLLQFLEKAYHTRKHNKTEK